MELSPTDRLLLRRTADQIRRRGRGNAPDKGRRKNANYKWSWAELHAKFTARVQLTAKGCWRWTGAFARGYGYLVYGSRQDHAGKQPRIQAHRLSYTKFVGPIPKDAYIGQVCNNKGCVNPDHLYLWRKS